MVTFNFRIDEETLNAARVYAQVNKTTVSDIIREGVSLFLTKRSQGGFVQSLFTQDVFEKFKEYLSTSPKITSESGLIEIGDEYRYYNTFGKGKLFKKSKAKSLVFLLTAFESTAVEKEISATIRM